MKPAINRRRPGQRAALVPWAWAALATLLGTVASNAAEPPPVPDAGALLRNLQPSTPGAPRPSSDAALPKAPPAPAAKPPAPGQRFTLRRVRVSGATVFSEAELLALLADTMGQPVDLPRLQALAERLTQHYRQAGYPLASAVLPPQDIVDGSVLITMTEGRFGAITLRGGAGLRTDRLPMAWLRAGEVIAEAPLERALLLLSDLPGVRVQATLQPGASVGTSDLVVDLQPGQRLVATVEADNHGSRSTGKQRLGASLAMNNPLGLGDALSLRAQGSTGGLLQYARLGWQLPVSRLGTKAGVAVSDMRYRLTGDFDALRATGRARVASVYASLPLLRSRTGNLQAQVLLDDKRLRDRIGATDSVADKSVGVLALSLSGDRSDGRAGGGHTAAALTWSSGRLRLHSADAQLQDQASAQTAGRFDKLLLSLTRRQTLGTWAGQPMALNLQYVGQWASKNLDSSEKLSLGGVGAVRAYTSGDASSDMAHLLSLELQRPMAADWKASLFADLGHGRTHARPWAAVADDATRHRAGAGIGVTWIPLPQLSLQVHHARRLGGATASATEPRARWLAQLQWTATPP